MRRISRWALILAAISAAGPTLGAGDAAAAPKTVVELFTSEGCSSCPPADRLFERYVTRDDVIALSFHVDYWDRLGWKDTLGDPAFTARQKRYAQARGDGEVYTPQMVINGRAHAVGSAAGAIDAAIAGATADKRIPVHLSVRNGKLSINAGAAGVGATLVLALAERSRNVRIDRGENRGRTVEYLNVVRVLKPLGAWRGTEVAVDIPATPGLMLSQAVVLLQDGEGGPIVGADAIDIPPAQF